MGQLCYDTPMIDHTGIGVSDLERSAAFYDAVLSALGLRRVMEIEGGIAYGITYPIWWIDRAHPAHVKQHTGFVAKDRAAVDAFHRAGLAAGGRDHGAPGLRGGGYPPGYYAAFLLDPDGNNIEAVVRES